MFDRAKLPLRSRSVLAGLVGLTALTTLEWTTPALAQNPAPAPVPAPSPANEPKVEAPKGTVGAQAAASSGATNLDDGKVAAAGVPAQDITHATELYVFG